MQSLDLLIAKFKEFQEELNKNLPLHDTVEGFMTGLKALPKGSAERGKFITSHMNHGPFLGALQTHPQGQQIHGMLTTHLNSAANAGFKAGQGKTMVKNDENDTLEETLEKGDYGMSDSGKVLSTPAPAPAPAATPKFKGSDLKVLGRGKLSGPGLRMPPAAPTTFKKTINQSYETDPNMAKGCGEKMTMAKNGQWNIEKVEEKK